MYNATLHPALSVRLSVRQSVGPLVCQSVGRSVHMFSFTFLFLFLKSLASLLLPKRSSDLKFGPCSPARDWGSRVSGLVYFDIVPILNNHFCCRFIWPSPHHQRHQEPTAVMTKIITRTTTTTTTTNDDNDDDNDGIDNVTQKPENFLHQTSGKRGMMTSGKFSICQIGKS